MEGKMVLLLGDDIRLAYQPSVADLLEAEQGVKVVAPAGSTGDSGQLAEGIGGWLDEFTPTTVHLNAGLDDVRWHRGEGHHAIAIGEYGINLQRIVDCCQARVGGEVVFALTTPVNDTLQCDRSDTEYDRCNRDIEEYNIAAQEIMLTDNVLINHLDRVIAERDDEFLAEDGVSLTEAGAVAAARAVVNCILSLWH